MWELCGALKVGVRERRGVGLGVEEDGICTTMGLHSEV